jgi:hypothetical protein
MINGVPNAVTYGLSDYAYVVPYNPANVSSYYSLSPNTQFEGITFPSLVNNSQYGYMLFYNTEAGVSGYSFAGMFNKITLIKQ